MLAAIVSLFSGLCSWLAGVLPNSPYQNFAGSGLNSMVSTYLGWFNWVCDVGAMMAVMTAWTGAMLTVFVVRWIKRNTVDNATVWVKSLG